MEDVEIVGIDENGNAVDRGEVAAGKVVDVSSEEIVDCEGDNDVEELVATSSKPTKYKKLPQDYSVDMMRLAMI